MKLVESVFEIAESFMKNPKYVTINDANIWTTTKEMLKVGKPIFPIPEVQDPFKGIILELVAASVNYCYWYGRHDIRPCGSSSTTMYNLMMNSFFDFDKVDYDKLHVCLDRFSKLLSHYRFPLLEQRISHLKELRKHSIEFCISIENKYVLGIGRDANLNYFLNELTEKFPGFASDIFLKRASLFFIQLFRRFGWFKNSLYDLHVPPDYQIPKMLEHYKCIEYSPSLKQAINDSQLIPKNSLQECEIRAATILAIQKLCKATGWNVAEVDGYFFTQRHLCDNPFHLTITTDY